jgi:protein-S-isoprenylcysteine O-methyltransferase Ste14
LPALEEPIILAAVSWLSPLRLCAAAWVALLGYWLWAARDTRPTKSTEGVLLRMQHIVPLVFAFLLIFHGSDAYLVYGSWHRQPVVEYAGVAATVAGLLVMVWGRVHLGRYWSGMVTLKEGHRLIRTGPYAWVRHPLYSGLLLGAAGSALAAGTGDAAAGFVLLAAAYVVKLRREETLLTREFGEEYARFMREVPALVPFAF